MIAKPESFSRWPLSPADRQALIDVLMDILMNAEPMHQIRAARVLLEMDAMNTENEVTVNFDHVRALLDEKQKAAKS